MSNIFGELQAEKEKQQEIIKKDTSLVEREKPVAQKTERKVEHKGEHIVAQKSAHPSKRVSILPDGEKIEELSFRLRREKKVKVSTNIPESWKKDLDRLSAELGVGKYDLLLFIISAFLKNKR